MTRLYSIDGAELLTAPLGAGPCPEMPCWFNGDGLKADLRREDAAAIIREARNNGSAVLLIHQEV